MYWRSFCFTCECAEPPWPPQIGQYGLKNRILKLFYIKSSVNLKGSPKWNPQTAFRAPHTTVQIAAWSPNRTRAQMFNARALVVHSGGWLSKWQTVYPTATYHGVITICGQKEVLPVFRGWPLDGTMSQKPGSWFWLSVAGQLRQNRPHQGRLWESWSAWQHLPV